MFVVDISKQSINDGSSLASIRALKNLLSAKSFKGKNTKIGIITFDDHVNFYDVRTNALETVRTLVVDPDDPLPPLPQSKYLFSPFVSSSIQFSRSNDTGMNSSYNNNSQNNNNNNNSHHCNSYDNSDSNSNKSTISNMSNLTSKTNNNTYNNNYNYNNNNNNYNSNNSNNSNHYNYNYHNISGIAENDHDTTNNDLDNKNNDEANCLLLLIQKLEKTCVLEMERNLEKEMRNNFNNTTESNNKHDNNNNYYDNSDNTCFSCSLAALKSAQLCLEYTGKSH